MNITFCKSTLSNKSIIIDNDMQNKGCCLSFAQVKDSEFL